MNFMENNTELFKKLISIPYKLGANCAELIRTCDIKLDRAFRDMCAKNACGMYGKCYMCPPDVGDIGALMAEIKAYDYALVYQTVTELEDSFDFEGMIEARKKMPAISKKLRQAFLDMGISDALHLSVGNCGMCEKCAKQTGEPCRFPDLAIPSLEAYGVDVSALAKAAKMNYTNGQNTVTYFGAVIFSIGSGTATVSFGKETIEVPLGTTVSEAISGERPCGGHGKCGKCKAIIKGKVSEITDTELKLLTEDEIKQGVRLACLTEVEGDCEALPYRSEGKAEILTYGALPHIELKPSFAKFGVAIDVGTTTLAARLYDKSAKMLADTSMLNPQSEWGADVISRIESALDGKASELAAAIRGAIDRMIAELADKAGINSSEIDGAVITGNTVMLSLLTEESTEPFSHAPFLASRLFGESIKAEILGLKSLDKNTIVYIPPCIHAFVGADTTCAIIATELCDSAEVAMLADIGTNGEMALYHDGKLTVCSTAAGPAFEGVGISMGMRGAVGAIDKVEVENGVFKAHVIGDVPPVGICGSALVDAAACMLDEDIIDESGYLEDEEFTVASPVVLTQKDIRMLQLAKSAICAGLMSLIKNEGISQKDVKRLFIAGGFGNYLGLGSAVKIGLLPSELAKVSSAVGNSTLAGASMLLLSSSLREKCENIASKAEVLELSCDKVFSDFYISGMIFGEMNQ